MPWGMGGLGAHVRWALDKDWELHRESPPSLGPQFPHPSKEIPRT